MNFCNLLKYPYNVNKCPKGMFSYECNAISYMLDINMAERVWKKNPFEKLVARDKLKISASSVYVHKTI